MGKFDGVYQNVPFGFAYVFEELGWEALIHVYEGTHHGRYGVMMRWAKEGEPIFPTSWKQVA